MVPLPLPKPLCNICCSYLIPNDEKDDEALVALGDKWACSSFPSLVKMWEIYNNIELVYSNGPYTESESDILFRFAALEQWTGKEKVELLSFLRQGKSLEQFEECLQDANFELSEKDLPVLQFLVSEGCKWYFLAEMIDGDCNVFWACYDNWFSFLETYRKEIWLLLCEYGYIDLIRCLVEEKGWTDFNDEGLKRACKDSNPENEGEVVRYLYPFKISSPCELFPLVCSYYTLKFFEEQEGKFFEKLGCQRVWDRVRFSCLESCIENNDIEHSLELLNELKDSELLLRGDQATFQTLVSNTRASLEVIKRLIENGIYEAKQFWSMACECRCPDILPYLLSEEKKHEHLDYEKVFFWCCRVGSVEMATRLLPIKMKLNRLEVKVQIASTNGLVGMIKYIRDHIQWDKTLFEVGLKSAIQHNQLQMTEFYFKHCLFSHEEMIATRKKLMWETTVPLLQLWHSYFPFEKKEILQLKHKKNLFALVSPQRRCSTFTFLYDTLGILVNVPEKRKKKLSRPLEFLLQSLEEQQQKKRATHMIEQETSL